MNKGDSVEVLISQPYDWKRNVQPEPVWTPGFTITGFSGAADRDYRVDVEGNGKEYRGCCPTCVRLIKGGAA